MHGILDVIFYYTQSLFCYLFLHLLFLLIYNSASIFFLYFSFHKHCCIVTALALLHLQVSHYAAWSQKQWVTQRGTDL
jgi:hypothetical protein